MRNKRSRGNDVRAVQSGWDTIEVMGEIMQREYNKGMTGIGGEAKQASSELRPQWFQWCRTDKDRWRVVDGTEMPVM